LPFIRQDKLYRDLKTGKIPTPQGGLEKAWDRPALMQTPFPVQWKRENPQEAWQTPYRVLVGKGTAFEKGAKITLNDFLDGVATTILVVDAADSVPWPKPDELEYDASKPLPKFSTRFPEGFYALFADNQIRLIPANTNEQTLRALITRNGGEKVDLGPFLVQ